MATFKLPTSEFRSLPIPGDGHAKLATCFVPVEAVPAGLRDWRKVNPRVPKVDRKDHVKGPVAKAIKDTLLEEPEKFVYMNLGLFLLSDHMSFEKGEGGQGVVTTELTDPDRHGVVNGGHTFQAICEAREERAANPDDYPPDWPAFVRLHIYEGVDPALIPELAEGLNRSLQVDNPSLENLRKTFESIKAALAGKRGADQVAYRQGDPGEVDIGEVLTYLGMFNLTRFPDRKKHPNVLFGQPKAVLDYFVADQQEGGPLVFDRVIPHTHEILVLADRIRQDAIHHLGRLKVGGGKSQNRARSPKNKVGTPAYFAGGTIDGAFPHGWLCPMLAAFRANVDREAWAAGRFAWIQDPAGLLAATVEEMADIVKQEHTDNKQKPAEVGRKEAAYRLCYGVIRDQLHGSTD
jgi:hypothetical protein